MALFGGMGAPEPIMAQGGMPPMPKRKNPLFGALSGAGKWLGGESGTPGVNRLSTIGATLKDLGGVIDGGDSDNLMNLQLLAQRRQQAEAQQGWQAEQQARQRQEWEAGDAESEALNNWVSTLPPDRQMMARALPKEALKAEFERMQPKDPKYFNTGQAVVGIGPDGQANVLYRDPVKPESGAAQYEVMTPEQVKAEGLQPGSYKRNMRTNDIIPIGRQKAQYTEFAGKSAQFADRMNSADKTLTALENAGVSPEGVFVARTGFGSEGERKFRQAKREFLNAVLRQESGAVIGPTEFESGDQQYFPQPGDNMAVIEQKRAARRRAAQGLMNSSQGAYEEWYGAPEQAPEEPKGRGALDARGGSRSGQKVRVWNPATGRLE